MSQKLDNSLLFALSFPQGHILFMENKDRYAHDKVAGIYFLPTDAHEAFLVWGSRQELFGKKAVEVSEDKDADMAAYTIVYEFDEAGALSDARLVTRGQTVRGKLADENFVQTTNAALAQGVITLYTKEHTAADKIFNVAQFNDGRLLVQLFNKNELYLGTPGHFQKLDARHVAQGGNSMYYALPDGGKISLPYGYGGPGRGDIPQFKDEVLTYRNDYKTGDDPAKVGLNLGTGIKHLAPFPKPQLHQTPPVPKPPGGRP